MKTTLAALAAATTLWFGTATAALSQDALEPDWLKGTVWAADELHNRVTIDSRGEVSIKEGKNIYVEFMDFVGGVYTIKIHWWNVDAKINVVEHAVLLPAAEGAYVYTEAEHSHEGDFPGIQGGGTFRLLDESEAELTQHGILLDLSASAFVTRLKRVDEAPEVPLAQTYPPPS